MMYFALNIDLPAKYRFVWASNTEQMFIQMGVLLDNWANGFNDEWKNLPEIEIGDFQTDTTYLAGCIVKIAYRNELNDEKLTEVTHTILAIKIGLVPIAYFQKNKSRS